MRTRTISCSLAALVAAAATSDAQTARALSTHTKTHPTSGASQGWAVDGIGDVDDDSLPDYVVGAPNVAGGQALVYSGTGTLLTTLSGTSGQVLCGGGAGADGLGYSVAGVGDLDRDGVDDFVVGSPFRPVASGSCFVPNHGGFTAFSGATLTPLFPSVDGPAPDAFLGYAVARVGSMPNGGPELYAVTSLGAGQNTVDVFADLGTSTAATFTGPGALFGRALSEAGDWNGDAVPDFACRTDGDSIQIWSILSTTTPIATITGPHGSEFGASIALLSDGPSPTLVVGAPGGAGGRGQVHVVSASGSTPVVIEGFELGDRLGTSVGAGDDVDGDGDPDFVAAAPGSRYVLIGDGQGNLTARTIVAPPDAVFNEDMDVAVLGDVTPDSFAEVLIGDPSANTSFVFAGGPDAIQAAFGQSCNQGSGNDPVLTASDDPVLGTTITLSLSGASPFSTASELHFGTPDVVGQPLSGGCTYHLASVPAPQVVYSTTTTGAGTWPSPYSFSVPVDMAALGLSYAFQALTIDPGTGTLDVSNAVRVTLGW